MVVEWDMGSDMLVTAAVRNCEVKLTYDKVVRVGLSTFLFVGRSSGVSNKLTGLLSATILPCASHPICSL